LLLPFAFGAGLAAVALVVVFSQVEGPSVPQIPLSGRPDPPGLIRSCVTMYR